MQYRLKAACGHLYTYNVYGSAAERERKANWLRSQPCPTCRRQAEARQTLTHNEAEIEREVTKLLEALQNEPRAEQAIRALEHQLREGLGDEIRREAVRRAIERYRLRNPS